MEQLEDRLTPAGSVIPAGEFNWTQYSPTGELGQLVWNGGTLVYRARVANTWHETAVASSGTFTGGQYNTTDQVQTASQTAQLVFTTDGIPSASSASCTTRPVSSTRSNAAPGPGSRSKCT